MTATAVAATGAALSAIGTGISLYSANQAASSQSAIAMENARAQADAARASSANQQMALRFQQLQEQGNAATASIQANAILQQSEAATNAAQANIRKQRMQFEALVARQYAALGQAGVSPVTGSPIDLLMENAAAEQEQEMIMRDEDEDRRRQAVREAVALQGAAFAGGVNSNLLSLEAAAVRQRGRMAVSQSRLDAAGQVASARGTRVGAWGQAASSVGQLGFEAYQFRKSTRIT
jgi:hypothetical protein